MSKTRTADDYMGRTAVDDQGEKIGSVHQVYVNDESGLPDWVTVKTGLFGGRDRFVPLHGSKFTGQDLVLPYGKDVVKDSPEAADTDRLDPEESEALYRYYEPYLDTPSTGKAGKNKTGTAAGGSDGYLTRSEERLQVGTEKVEGGRARLRKYVVTEQQTVTVPVTHDEVTVVREPLQPGDVVDGATIGEDAIEVTLMKDNVLVTKDVVGVEKVKLATEQVTEQRKVTETVRKEKIETTGDTAGTAPTKRKKK